MRTDAAVRFTTATVHDIAVPLMTSAKDRRDEWCRKGREGNEPFTEHQRETAMKKTILTATGILILSSSMAFAAPGPGRRGDCDGSGPGARDGKHMMMRGDGEHMARMFERLDLSEAQKTQILQLREQLRAEAAPQHEALRQNMQALRDAKLAGDQATIDSLQATIQAQKAEMEKIRESHHARLSEILTPEQREQFEAMRAERGGKRGGKHRGHGGRF